MNTMSKTTASKIFRNVASGEKFLLPSDFPSAKDRADIAELWAPLGAMDARGNFAHAVQLLTTGWIPADENKDDLNGIEEETIRFAYWESIKDGFRLEFGHDWTEYLMFELREMEPKNTTEATEAEKVMILDLKADKKGFQRVPKEKWNSLLYGAYSSRRACVSPSVWCGRMVAAGWAKALVGTIAEIAWSTPITELDLH